MFLENELYCKEFFKISYIINLKMLGTGAVLLAYATTDIYSLKKSNKKRKTGNHFICGTKYATIFPVCVQKLVESCH